MKREQQQQTYTSRCLVTDLLWKTLSPVNTPSTYTKEYVLDKRVKWEEEFNWKGKFMINMSTLKRISTLRKERNQYEWYKWRKCNTIKKNCEGNIRTRIWVREIMYRSEWKPIRSVRICYYEIIELHSHKMKNVYLLNKFY